MIPTEYHEVAGDDTYRNCVDPFYKCWAVDQREDVRLSFGERTEAPASMFEMYFPERAL